MARIFISHSASNNEAALQMRDWLEANGWPDVFLDLDPERGVRAGEAWQQALIGAADRCEEVEALPESGWVSVSTESSRDDYASVSCGGPRAG